MLSVIDHFGDYMVVVNRLHRNHGKDFVEYCYNIDADTSTYPYFHGISVVVPKLFAEKYYSDIPDSLENYKKAGEHPTIINVLKLFKKDFNWRLKHVKVKKNALHLRPDFGALFWRTVTLRGINASEEIELKLRSFTACMATVLDFAFHSFNPIQNNFFRRMWNEYLHKEIYVDGRFYEV